MHRCDSHLACYVWFITFNSNILFELDHDEKLDEEVEINSFYQYFVRYHDFSDIVL